MFPVFITFLIELYQAFHHLAKQLEIFNIKQHTRSLLFTLPQCLLGPLEVHQLLILGDLDFIVLVFFGYLLSVLFLVQSIDMGIF